MEVLRRFPVTEATADVEKEEYAQLVSEIRVQLVRVQQELRGADFPVLIFLAGEDGPGIVDVMQKLNEWFDPRNARIFAFDRPSEEQRIHPSFWRYWRRLPAKGTIGVFLGGWTTSTVIERVEGRLKRKKFARELDDVRNQEQMLVRDGYLILKFWLQTLDGDTKKRKRRTGKEPTVFRRHEHDLGKFEDTDRVRSVVREAIEATSSPEAPWHVVGGEHERHRRLEVARIVCEQVAERLEGAARVAVHDPPGSAAAVFERPKTTVLDEVDLGESLKKDEYEELLEEYQQELHELSHQAGDQGIATVLAFEGWDAAGKGGVIRRLCAGVDPPTYHVVPIAAPTDEERAHHYLWRFWRQVPRAGHMTIFDRSWYGRVLVERVEGFARADEWMRAYEEIVQFEELLVESSVVVAKFWLHIDRDEQLRRFEAREETPFKKYKITPEDYRNRNHWEDYEIAVHDMVTRTSTEAAPWEIVPANNKRWARIQVIKTVCRRLREALNG